MVIAIVITIIDGIVKSEINDFKVQCLGVNPPNIGKSLRSLLTDVSIARYSV
jgi:hypothetical protein